MTYTARVTRWDEGWELHIDNVGVTQVRSLANAAAQAADLVNTYLDTDIGADDIDLVFDLGAMSDEITKARGLVRDAERLAREAASESRRVARSLRAQGLSVTDTAAVLGVSRGRVSQLAGKS